MPSARISPADGPCCRTWDGRPYCTLQLTAPYRSGPNAAGPYPRSEGQFDRNGRWMNCVPAFGDPTTTLFWGGSPVETGQGRNRDCLNSYPGRIGFPAAWKQLPTVQSGLLRSAPALSNAEAVRDFMCRSHPPADRLRRTAAGLHEAAPDFYLLLSSVPSMSLRICAMSIAPLACCGCPSFGMKMKVGMLRTPNRAARRCSLSTSTL